MAEAKAAAMPFNEAVSYFRQKIDLPTKHWTEVMDEAHARSFAIAGATDKAMLADFRKALDGALVDGTGFQKFRGQFDDIVKKYGWQHTGKAGWRAKVIYETNMRTAYAAGRYAQQTRPAVLAAFPYWQYLHVNCPNPRLQHVAWSGMVLRADDPFWATNYPPNGWGCHCIVVSMNDRMVAQAGCQVQASPDLQWQEYVNRKTGVVTRVPQGVDPGFAYNPGKAWAEGKPAVLKSPDLRPVKKPRTLEIPTPEKFPDIKATDVALTDAMRPWANSLTDIQKTALSRYKVAIGTDLNEALLTGQQDNPLIDAANALKAALSDAKMPFTVRTFRAVGSDELKKYMQTRVGGSVSMETFLSATLDRQVANFFKTRGNRVVIEIYVRKDTSGVAYVHPFPTNQHRQFEVLLNAGVKLTIVKNDGNRLVLVAGEDDDDEN